MVQQLIILTIKLYRLVFSPILPASCRFSPSCSEYALISVERFGVLKGGALAVRRILKCHPWGPVGGDPVPLASEKE